jgi:hypothetical protein
MIIGNEPDQHSELFPGPSLLRFVGALAGSRTKVS